MSGLLPEGSGGDATANNNDTDLPPYDPNAYVNEVEMKQMDVAQEEEVVMVQQAQPQPQTQQGPVMVVVSQPPQQMVVTSQRQQPMPQQQQQQGVILSPTNSSNTVPVSENPYLKSNNVLTDKRKEFMIGVDIGYFKVKAELGHLDEMKPWESDGQMYSFGCCTELNEGMLMTAATDGKKAAAVSIDSREGRWAHTVYHKTNTEMLTVLKKEMVSVQSTFDLVAAKNPNVCLHIWFRCMIPLLCLGGLILIVVGAAFVDDDSDDNDTATSTGWDSDTGEDSPDGGAMLAFGIIFLVIVFGSVIVLKCVAKMTKTSASSTSQELEITTTSIPIYCVRSVKRKATLTHSKSSAATHSNSCNCCAPNTTPLMNSEQKDDVCVVTIYYRSAESEGLVADSEIEVKLSAHQGFNLQRYLNCIIDGCHPKWRESFGDRNRYQLELKKER